MYYKKITTEYCTIEFKNDLWGTETVSVNGQVVSKKSSITGTDHHFTVTEKGQPVRYVLTTKLGGMQVYIDLRRDGKLIREDIPIHFGTKPGGPKNPFKTKGIKLLNEYAVGEAITELKKALEINREDPEIYFYLACGYSIEEKALRGFECLKQAVANNLQNTAIIHQHDMLAYLRMQDGFEDFSRSNFTEFDASKLAKEEEEE